MAARRTRHRWQRLGLLAAAAMLAATGCGTGSPTPASERVPDLSTTLSTIDSAIARHQYDQARAALDSLVQTTAGAAAVGDLDAAQADAITAAAERLLSALPDHASAGSSTPPTTDKPDKHPPPGKDKPPKPKDKPKDHGHGHGPGH